MTCPAGSDEKSRGAKSKGGPVKTRSRTGCRQCKQRRVKCDETKPECLVCLRSNRTCSGYPKTIRWSTKHEVTPVINFDKVGVDPSIEKAWADLVTFDNTMPTPPGSTGSAERPTDASTGLLGDHEPSEATLAPDALDMTWQSSLENWGISQFDFGGITDEPILDGMDQDAPCDDIFTVVAERNCPSTTDETSNLDPNEELEDLDSHDFYQELFNTPPPTTQAHQARQQVQKHHQQHEDEPQSLFQMSRSLSHKTTVLVEEWFRRVCPMWSTYDSEMNMNRQIALETWTHSKAVNYCLQAMSATWLSVQMPQMRKAATSYMKSAVDTIKEELVELKKQKKSTKVPSGLLLALCAVGTTGCWLDSAALGKPCLREAKKLIERSNRHCATMSDKEKLALSYFNDCVMYWSMLIAFVSDDDDLDHSPPSPPDKPKPQPLIHASRLVPHPWTGTCASTENLFARVVRLSRKFRLRLRRGRMSTAASLHTALEDIRSARDIEAQLLDLRVHAADEISDTGDARTARSHFVAIAESYRLAALLQLYQTFPDLVERRLPSAARDKTTAVAAGQDEEFIWDKWMVPLSLQLVSTLRRVPTTSGTQCIQPILYITASTGLRFDRSTLAQRQQLLESSSLSSAGIITELSVEVTHGRRFVMERLSTLEHSLAPAPIKVAKSLVEATWAKYDAEAPGTYSTHWVDVMEESGLRTIFG